MARGVVRVGRPPPPPAAGADDGRRRDADRGLRRGVPPARHRDDRRLPDERPPRPQRRLVRQAGSGQAALDPQGVRPVVEADHRPAQLRAGLRAQLRRGGGPRLPVRGHGGGRHPLRRGRHRVQLHPPAGVLPAGRGRSTATRSSPASCGGCAARDAGRGRGPTRGPPAPAGRARAPAPGRVPADGIRHPGLDRRPADRLRRPRRHRLHRPPIPASRSSCGWPATRTATCIRRCRSGWATTTAT